jgi:hypothetical protein
VDALLTVRVLCALAIWLALTQIRSSGWLIFWKLPATVLHELSHWTVALVTGCRPGFPVIWPKKDGKTWVLGSVTFHLRPGSTALVALAPFWVLLPLALFLCTGTSNDTPREVGVGIFSGFLCTGAAPSSTDLKIALGDPLGLLLFAVLCYCGYDLWVTS